MFSKLPRITIITVCYNADKLLEKTILSVINQTYSNIEYVIIDGDSKDGTKDIINKYISSINIAISEKDNGIYDAMNKGIRIASGDFIIFMNAGDEFDENSTIESVFNMNYDSNCVIYGQVRFIPSNRIVDGKFNKYKLSRHNIPHQAIFYSAKYLKKYEYNLKYNLYADYFLNLTLFSKKEIKFIYCDKIIAKYLQGGVSANLNNDTNFTSYKYDIIGNILGKKYKMYAVYHEKIRKLIRRYIKARKY